MASAGLCQGLESIVETWVSVLEHHSSKQRNLSQDRLHHEAMVAINGPAVVHCDKVVKEALTMFYSKAKREGSKDGNFVRRSENIKPFMVSKAVDTLVSKKPRLPIMLN